MSFAPDVIVTTDYSPATIALVGEAKASADNLDEGAHQLKQYMLRMNCPVGVILTPTILRIYKDRFVGRTQDSIELVGDFPSAELFEAWQPVANTASAIESALVGWLDNLAQTGQVGVGDPRLQAVIGEHILPAISGGRVSIVRPRVWES